MIEKLSGLGLVLAQTLREHHDEFQESLKISDFELLAYDFFRFLR